jgi:hypothetical protein
LGLFVFKEGIDMEKDQIASDIVNGPVFDMVTPLSKLKAVAELLYCAGDSNVEFGPDHFIGIGEILKNITVEFESLKKDAEETYTSAVK